MPARLIAEHMGISHKSEIDLRARWRASRLACPDFSRFLVRSSTLSESGCQQKLDTTIGTQMIEQIFPVATIDQAHGVRRVNSGRGFPQVTAHEHP
jgi:hypothetical protein